MTEDYYEPDEDDYRQRQEEEMNEYCQEEE